MLRGTRLDKERERQRRITQAAQDYRTSVTGRDSFGNWVPSSIPVMLAEGKIDPTQLSGSKDYNRTLESANQYSLEKFGKPSTSLKRLAITSLQRMLKLRIRCGI